ncbi:MAG: extracellular solute-binding protein [Chloroflexota bacterium]|nr:extracellular solute-binding protein [Chloroflexota bacterium]
MTRTPQSRLSRRRALQAGGGLAAAAIAGQRFSIMSAFAQDNVEVSIWGNHPEWTEPMQEIIDAFEAAVPGVTVQLTEQNGPDYFTLLQTAVTGGQPSDIIGLGEGEIISKWLPSGDPPFIDLTGKVDISGLTDAARSQVEVDGKVYACPLAAYTVGLAINNGVMERYEVSPPTTWDELRAVAQKVKEGGDSGLVLGGKDWVHTYFMYTGLVSSIIGFEGVEKLRTGELKLTDPEPLQAAQLLVELQPYYNDGFQATDYTTSKAIFANGLGAMMVAGTADFTGFYEVNPEANLGFVAWPGPSAGQKATTTGFELLYGVSKFASPEKQDAAAKFVNWLATTEAQQLVSDKIALPINVNVTSSTDPIRQATVEAAAGGDVPVWYDLPEFNGIVGWMQTNFGGLWAGSVTAEEFAGLVQEQIITTDQLATPTA